jgi:hypothetical protein
MYKYLLGAVAALAVSAGLSSEASAGWYHYDYFYNYHLTNGVRFRYGYYFRGPAYAHFAYRTWYGRYHTYCYYYPGTRAWYYWSADRAAYYPVSYITVAPPSGSEPDGIVALSGTLPEDVLPPR